MDSIEEFLANYPLDMQAISQTLRTLVKNAMPQAQEVLYASNNHIGYSITGSMADRIVYICPMKNYVRFGFMRGTQLPDPNQLLEGEGKWLRHIKVRTLKDTGHPALEPLIRAAWDDAKTHAKEKKL